MKGIRRLDLVSLEDRSTPATLNGVAYLDANFNGTLDGGETPLAGVAVTLDLNGLGTTILATATNASGQYSFAGVANGTHTLAAIHAGHSPVTPNPIGVNVATTGTISVNLGFAPSAVVSGFAFSDMNGNGNLDTGERLLPNYSVTLDLGNDGSGDATVFTDSNGQFHFVGVANGTHKVTIPNATIAPTSKTITVTAGGDVSGIGFAVTPTGKLEGIAYLDSNATGVQDAGEAGLSGATINIDFYSNGSIDRTVTTGTDGKYSFIGIPDGTHTVTASRPGHFNSSPGNISATYLIGNYLLPPVPPPSSDPRTPGDPVGFPNQIPTSFGFAQSAIVSGFIYGDTNGNGTPNLSEPEIQGVVVRLDVDNNGTFDATTTTDLYGRYAFSAVANGTHKVAITLPAGYTGATTAKTVAIAGGVNSTGNSFTLGKVAPQSAIAVSTDSPFMNQVKVLNTAGVVTSTFAPFANNGDTRVDTGDVNGDTIDDFAVATGAGRTTLVRVLDGASGAELFSIQPYGSGFFGGAFVSLGDITGDGRAELVITPDITGGPRVRVFNGNGFGQIADFFGIDDVNFRGGARTAVGDLDNDGKGDLIVTAGFGGGPRVALFDGAELGLNGGPKFIGDFFAFEPDLRNGAFVTAGDVNGDGFDDLIAGAGLGGAPRITVFSGQALIVNTQTKLADFFAGGQIGDRSGVKLSVEDIDSDGKADIVTGYRHAATFASRLAAYPGKNLSPSAAPTAAFDIEPFPGFLGGISVG